MWRQPPTRPRSCPLPLPRPYYLSCAVPQTFSRAPVKVRSRVAVRGDTRLPACGPWLCALRKPTPVRTLPVDTWHGPPAGVAAGMGHSVVQLPGQPCRVAAGPEGVVLFRVQNNVRC